MRSRGIVFCIAVVTAVISLYYLSFTLVDCRVQRQAERQAMDQQGSIDFDRYQTYLMEQWRKPVYRLLGVTYTYAEVKERALKLGLDLQGGMHVVMELMPVELVKNLTVDPTDPLLVEALTAAYQQQVQGAPTSFAHLFIAAYKPLAREKDISSIFQEHILKSYALVHEKDVVHMLDQEIARALDRSMTIIRSRLDRFGAMQPLIQRLPGTGRIQIELPGVTNPERVRKLLQGVAQLRFWEVADKSAYHTQWDQVDRFLLQEEVAEIKKIMPHDLTEAEREGQLPKVSLLQRLMKGATSRGLLFASQDMQQVDALLRRRAVQMHLPSNIIWMWGKKEELLADGTAALCLYPIQSSRTQKPLLEGDIITYARQEMDHSSKQVMVTMHMNAKGAHIWREITANHIGKPIAITLDDRVYTAPTVNQEIPNGWSTITGDFTVEEAKDLASVLQTGALPARLKVVEEVVMGPSLGKLAQQQGLITTAVGLVLVLLFIVAYYARGGMVAGIALLFNLLFIVGILVQLDATLTLPGIAGLVLTIGMSIDANVLIFERIREELAQKVPIKEAIHRGYKRSYSSIVDANVTTFLTGMVLYYLGQGQVRGFAVILMIGIISSVFTSIFITGWLFSWYIDRYPLSRLTFSYEALPKLFQNVSFNFTRNRYYFYLFSLTVIATGATCFYRQGLAWGVDFIGGRSYIVHFHQPIDVTQLKQGLATQFRESIAVRTYGANNMVQITTSHLMHEDDADQKVRHKLETALANLTNVKDPIPGGTSQQNTFTITSSSRVGAAVARDIQKSAKKAIGAALLGIFLYIALRFRRWKYGLASIIALIHDALAVLAGFCVARALGFSYEINEVFLAAMLTVIGYSINDTVVIFDRIRERLSMTTRLQENRVIINQAIGETLSRTMITSFTTLLVIIMLFCFGGEALRGFSFALLLGVLFGTYSSICIAAPLLADMSPSKT